MVVVADAAKHVERSFGLIKNKQPAAAENTRAPTSKCGPQGVYSRHRYLHT